MSGVRCEFLLRLWSSENFVFAFNAGAWTA